MRWMGIDRKQGQWRDKEKNARERDRERLEETQMDRREGQTDT